MNYPELLLLPILMFADYFLTVVGAVQKEKKYSNHFTVQNYELNPIWQQDIAQKKWLNLRHILFTVLITVLLIFLTEFFSISPPMTNLSYFGLSLSGFVQNQR